MAEGGTYLRSHTIYSYSTNGRMCHRNLANNRFDYIGNYTRHWPCNGNVDFNRYENRTLGNPRYYRNREEFVQPECYRNDGGFNEDYSPLSFLADVGRQRIRFVLVENMDQSVMDFALFKRIQSRGRFIPLSWKAATTYPSTVKGYFELAFYVENVKFVQIFKLVERSDYNVVLATDFISQRDVDFNAVMKTLKVRDTYVKLSNDQEFASIVRITRDFVIKQHSTTVMTAKVRGISYFQTGSQIRVVRLNSGFLARQTGISLTEDIVYLPFSRRIKIKVRNNTDRSLRLYKGTKVGRIMNLSSVQLSNQNIATINAVEIIARPTETDNVKGNAMSSRRDASSQTEDRGSEIAEAQNARKLVTNTKECHVETLETKNAKQSVANKTNKTECQIETLGTRNATQSVRNTNDVQSKTLDTSTGAGVKEAGVPLDKNARVEISGNFGFKFSDSCSSKIEGNQCREDKVTKVGVDSLESARRIVTPTRSNITKSKTQTAVAGEEKTVPDVKFRQEKVSKQLTSLNAVENENDSSGYSTFDAASKCSVLDKSKCDISSLRKNSRQKKKEQSSATWNDYITSWNDGDSDSSECCLPVPTYAEIGGFVNSIIPYGDKDPPTFTEAINAVYDYFSPADMEDRVDFINNTVKNRLAYMHAMRHNRVATNGTDKLKHTSKTQAEAGYDTTPKHRSKAHKKGSKALKTNTRMNRKYEYVPVEGVPNLEVKHTPTQSFYRKIYPCLKELLAGTTEKKEKHMENEDSLRP